MPKPANVVPLTFEGCMQFVIINCMTTLYEGPAKVVIIFHLA